jgi:hypothetical protein
VTKSKGIRPPYKSVSWPPEKKAQLAAMWRAGASDEAIAKSTGHTVRAVAIQRSKLGLVKRTQRPRESALTRAKAVDLVTELRRRGYTVFGPEGSEVFGIDQRIHGPSLSGVMVL